MSNWNIGLGSRKKVVVVDKILRKIPEHAAGFTGMEIQDQQGRTHTLSAVDFISNEWEQIREGTKIELTIREQITGIKVVS